ncbi:MAG: hypothetical protein WC485_00375 [Opitutaceae bacterium]
MKRPSRKLIQAHRIWQTEPRCAVCHCRGNQECGHDCVPGHGCELDINGEDEGICYCCRAERLARKAEKGKRC